MRKQFIILLLLIYTGAVYTQEIVNIHKKNTSILNLNLETIDSLRFGMEEPALSIFHSGSKISEDVLISGIDSITFTDEAIRPVRKTYSNPVSLRSLPDPTIIRAEDGYFYLYATEDTYNMPIMRSGNLLDWIQIGTVFTNATRPVFEPGGGLWAPSINYINGKYVLYYSMSIAHVHWTCGIGVAVADRPQGPFTDLGKLFQSQDIGVRNSIDPFYMEENGRKYLFWGSFYGLFGIELSDDGLTLKEGAQKSQVGGTWFEATYIHKRNGYYYLFASIGYCCAGLDSTYELVVGRSKSLFGTYTNKAGERMLDNKFEYIVRNNNRFVGNGHCSEILTDDDGNDWILYHGVDKENPQGRKLLLDEIHWTDDDWPYIRGGTPSLKAEAPVIYR